MQVPDYTFRPLAADESVRDNEVEVSAAQKERIEMLLDKERMRRREMLDARPHMSKASRRRRGY